MENRNQHFGGIALDDVARIVDDAGWASLARALQLGQSKKEARLACSTLKRRLDGNARQATYRPSHRSLQQWEQGALSAVSPIQHWDRCKEVVLSINRDDLRRPPAEVAQMLALPLVGLTLEARQRITRLTLYVEEHFEEPRPGHPIPWLPLTLLLARLPGLRQLDLSGALPSNRLEQQMVYDALAGLPHLTTLRMPLCRAVDNLGALAGKLRRLELFDDFGPVLDEAMVAAIARLQRLQQLSVGAPPGDLRILAQLLRSAPPSLEVLQVPACAYHEHHTTICMSNGRVTSVRVFTPSGGAEQLQLDDVEELAGCALLPSGAVGPQMQLFTADRLVVHPCADDEAFGDDEGQAPDPVQHSWPQLRALLRQCARIEVGCVRLHPMPPAAAAEVLALLRGARIVELVLPSVSFLGACIRIDTEAHALPPAWSLPPPQQQQQLAAQQKPGGGPAVAPPPPPVALVELALAHILGSTAEAEAAAAAAAVAVAATEAQAAAGDVAAESTTGVHDMADVPPAAAVAAQLVLLRGPLLSGLAWSTKALKAWVQQLAEQAAAGAGAGTGEAAHTRGAARPPQGALPVCACLALPSASALLLQCRSAAAAAAVQAAARAAAEALGGMAGPDNPVAQLQAAAAALAEAPAGRVVRQANGLDDLLANIVAQVAQAAWRSGALGGLGGQEERLQWLLGQWEQVCGWRAVYL